MRAMDTTRIERRSFLWKAGAAFSATAAAAATALTPGTRDTVHASKEMLLSQDRNAIRALHRQFMSALNERRYADAVELFAEDSEVHFHGGSFIGKHRGVRRLYVEHLGGADLERTMHPAYGVLLALPATDEELIEIAADRSSGTARFDSLVQATLALPSNLPLVEMAQLQGQGVLRWWERGRYENAYVNEGGVWRIKALVHRPLWRAWDLLGRSMIPAGCIPRFSTSYPDDPAGPDELIALAAVDGPSRESEA
jgi:hypothetical protein